MKKIDVTENGRLLNTPIAKRLGIRETDVDIMVDVMKEAENAISSQLEDLKEELAELKRENGYLDKESNSYETNVSRQNAIVREQRKLRQKLELTYEIIGKLGAL